MSKRKKQKSKMPKIEYKIAKCENGTISSEKLIDIQAEAYYRALKRIESEKNNKNSLSMSSKKPTHIVVLFMLNVVFFPWKIHRRFRIKDKVYDDLLVMFVSGTLKIIGAIFWAIMGIMFAISQMMQFGITIDLLNSLLIAGCFLMFGSFFILAGEEFNKETDSQTIYAYSACLIALISCLVSIITLIRTF